MNVNANPMMSMSPEDRIRQLIGMGVGQPAANATNDAMGYVQQFGKPQDMQGANQMADYLRQRGHNVNINP